MQQIYFALIFLSSLSLSLVYQFLIYHCRTFSHFRTVGSIAIETWFKAEVFRVRCAVDFFFKSFQVFIKLIKAQLKFSYTEKVSSLFDCSKGLKFITRHILSVGTVDYPKNLKGLYLNFFPLFGILIRGQ